jgi:hypothetical protein
MSAALADGGSHGSHPHARPNWRPAETIDEYMSNCREGLEDFSDRRAAKLLGMTRIQLYRAKLMAETARRIIRVVAQGTPQHQGYGAGRARSAPGREHESRSLRLPELRAYPQHPWSRQQTRRPHRQRMASKGTLVSAALASNTTDRLAKQKAQLQLFARRCLDFADRVAANQIAFLDAIDVCYEAALAAGLVDDLGDDIVQATMAAAFANAKRPA